MVAVGYSNNRLFSGFECAALTFLRSSFFFFFRRKGAWKVEVYSCLELLNTPSTSVEWY